MDQDGLYISEPITELFDLKNDISESNDLSKGMPDLLRSMNQELAQWLKDVGVELPRENPEFNYDSAFVRSRKRPW